MLGEGKGKSVQGVEGSDEGESEEGEREGRKGEREERREGGGEGGGNCVKIPRYNCCASKATKRQLTLCVSAIPSCFISYIIQSNFFHGEEAMFVKDRHRAQPARCPVSVDVF